MDPVQVYETTIFNRERAGEAFRFLTVPARALPGREMPPPDRVVRALGLPTRPMGRVAGEFEPWHLPVLIDAALGREVDFPYWMEFGPRGRRSEAPSRFAQYLAFEPLIPFESSPLGSKSLASLATTAATVGTTGTALGVAATERPTLLIWVPLGIVIGGAALGAGVAGFEAVVYHLRRFLRLPDDSDDG